MVVEPNPGASRKLLGVGCLIFLLSLGLRLYRLDAENLWMDEAGQAEGTGDRFARLFWIARGLFPHGPLPALICHPFTHYTNSDFLWRLPHAVMGACSVVLVYSFLAAEVELIAAAIAAMLMAFNPLHLALSQELRPYAGSIFFVSLALWSYGKTCRRFRETDSESNSGMRALTWINALGLLNFVWHGLWMIAQALHAMSLALLDEQWSGRWRFFLLNVRSLAISSVPWLMWYYVVRTGDVVTPPPSESFTKVIWSALSALAGGNAWSTCIQCALVATGMVWLIARRRFFTATGSLIFLLPLIVLPVVLDFWKPYFFHPRQVLNILPAFAALTAIGLSALARPLASLSLRIGIQSAGACALIAASCATSGLYSYREHKPVELRSWIERHARENRTILVLNSHRYTDRTFRIYCRRYYGERAAIVDPDIGRMMALAAPVTATQAADRALYTTIRRNANTRDVLLCFDLFDFPNSGEALRERLKAVPMVADVLIERNAIAVLLRAPDDGQPLDWLDSAVSIHALVPEAYEYRVKLRLLRALLPRESAWDEMDRKIDAALKAHGY